MKRTSVFREPDLAHLRAFKEDYPIARTLLFYGGSRAHNVEGVRVLPLARALCELPEILGA